MSKPEPIRVTGRIARLQRDFAGEWQMTIAIPANDAVKAAALAVNSDLTFDIDFMAHPFVPGLNSQKL